MIRETISLLGKIYNKSDISNLSEIEKSILSTMKNSGYVIENNGFHLSREGRWFLDDLKYNDEKL